jgi:uncharacterized protein YciI
MPHFVFKLLAPRPSFPADITAQERTLMDAHVAYWADLVVNDVALVFGPVFDPDGIYGLAIAQAKDEQDARQLSNRDPAIEAGQGFRYDIHPMQAATRPDVVAALSKEKSDG